MEVYVVTYWKKDGSIKPVVTIFNNHKAAVSCYTYFFNQGDYECILDTAPVLGDFRCFKEEK